MKKIVLSAAILLAFSIQKAQGRAKIPIGSVEKIEKVAELPDVPEYKAKDGKYIDIASKFTVFTIAWIPIYTEKAPELVGYTGEGDSFYEIPTAEMDVILKEKNLDRKQLEKMSFWNAYGGKLIIAVILLLILWAYLPSRKKKEEVEVVPQNL